MLDLANSLDELQAIQNNGRGVSCIRSVVFSLKKNDIQSAKVCIRNEWDKISQYKEIVKFLKKHKLADENLYERDYL